MRTRSRSHHKIVEPLRIEFHSKEDQFQEDPPEVSMAENQTMAQLLQAPTMGYEDAIVIPEIAATNFELKHAISSDVAELKEMVRALLLDKKNQSSALATSSTPAPLSLIVLPAVVLIRTKTVPLPAGTFIKTTSTILRNIQSQGQSMQSQCQNIQNQYQMVQNQLANLTDMMSKFMSSNMDSSSGSGTLPGNTVTNPKEDLKGITTRSGVAY
nr:hypothetical protein [Tanacetum cinerariifolium]